VQVATETSDAILKSRRQRATVIHQDLRHEMHHPLVNDVIKDWW